jgi:RNA polymerase sigma-70 factor, ECF subfamily
LDPQTLESEVTALYHEYAASLLHCASGWAANADEARDAVQEVFLRYFTERRYGREIRSVRPWLFQVLKHHLFQLTRTTRYREIVFDLDRVPSTQQNPEAILGLKQAVRAMEAALTRRERECLRLRSEGLSYEEIAARLEISSGTVGTLLARAYRKMWRPGPRVKGAPAPRDMARGGS